MCRIADHIHHLALLVGERRIEQLVDYADHPVHRRADLVAHAGEEGALRLALVDRRIRQAQQLILDAAQFFLRLDAPADLACQLDRAVGQLVVHAHHGIDQDAGGTGHFLVGLILGTLQRDAAGQGQDDLGHALVGLDDV